MEDLKLVPDFYFVDYGEGKILLESLTHDQLVESIKSRLAELSYEMLVEFFKEIIDYRNSENRKIYKLQNNLVQEK